jgi:hypothetical protein
VWALYALAAIQIISAILSIATMGATIDAAREAVEGTSDGDTIVTTMRISSYVGLAFGVAFAAGFSVLAVFVGRGAQPARIISWVALGLMLCCNGFGLLGAAAGGVLSGAGGDTGDVDQDRLTRSIEESIPGWLTPVNYVLLFLGILASAAGIILLALPAANQFFRRREAIFEPPVPGAYYPTTPGAPGAPGEPAQAAPVGDPVLPAHPPVADTPAETTPAVDVTKPADEPPAGTATPVDVTKSADGPAADGTAPPAEPASPEDRNDGPGPSGRSGTGNPPPAL